MKQRHLNIPKSLSLLAINLKPRLVVHFRRSMVYLSVVTLLLTTTMVLYKPKKAEAWASATLPTCEQYDLNWDWKTSAAADTSITGAAANWLARDAMMLYQSSTYNGRYMLMAYVRAGTNASFRLKKDAAVANPPYYLEARTGTGTGISGIGGVATIWTLDTQTHTVTPGNGSINQGSGTVTKITDVTCIRSITQLPVPYAGTYDSSYDGFQGYTNIEPEQGEAACNGILDVGCWIAKGFAGVANTVLDVIKAAFGLFSKLFLPDGAKLSTEFDNLQTSLTETMGFLTFPFDFVGDMFSALSGTSDNWCTSSSCTKDFGNLFGHDFTVDFRQPATTYSSLWTWGLGLFRGLIIFELMLAVLNKYRKVTQK